MAKKRPDLTRATYRRRNQREVIVWRDERGRFHRAPAEERDPYFTSALVDQLRRRRSRAGLGDEPPRGPTKARKVTRKPKRAR